MDRRQSLLPESRGSGHVYAQTGRCVFKQPRYYVLKCSIHSAQGRHRQIVLCEAFGSPSDALQRPTLDTCLLSVQAARCWRCCTTFRAQRRRWPGCCKLRRACGHATSPSHRQIARTQARYAALVDGPRSAQELFGGCGAATSWMLVDLYWRNCATSPQFRGATSHLCDQSCGCMLRGWPSVGNAQALQDCKSA